MDPFKPSEAPKAIKTKKYKENILLYIVPIVFLAVIFMLYIFAWEEAKSFQKINQIKIESEAALKEIATDSQKTITFLQSEIRRLETGITGKKDKAELEQFVGNIITLEAALATKILSHPKISLDTETHYDYHYIDTDYGQIQALRGEQIQCDDILILTGTIYGLYKDPNSSKDMHDDYYMMIQDYECLNTKTNFSCQIDSDCVLQRTSCDLCACQEVTNEENRIAIKCPAPDEDIICDSYCPYNTPKCIGGKCQLIKSK